jgi:hypothetical protein
MDSLGIWMTPIVSQPGGKFSVLRFVPSGMEIALREHMTQKKLLVQLFD